MDHQAGLSHLIRICAPQKKAVLIAVLLLAIAAIADFLPYLSMYGIVSEILLPVQDPSADLDTVRIFQLVGLVLAAMTLNVISYFAAVCLLHKAAFETIYLLKTSVLHHVSELPLGFGIRMGSGNIRKILDEDIGKTEDFLAHQFPDFVYTAVTCLTVLTALLLVDWRYGLICLSAVIIALLILRSAFKLDSENSAVSEFFQANSEMSNIAVEYVRGIAVLKICNATLVTFEKFYEAIKRYTKAAMKYTLQLEKVLSSYSVIIYNIYLFFIPVIIYIGKHGDEYTSFVSKTIFCILVTPAITATMLRIVLLISQAVQFHYGMQSVDAILHEPAIQSQHPSGTVAINSYDIGFEDVTFSYDAEKSEYALHHVSFVARERQTTALVGGSGSGKTTVAQLIPRFYDIDGGRITIGGHDIRSLPLDDLMRMVSFVFQDAFLFKKSIRDNIAMGREDATLEEIVSAAKNAQCHAFVERLPDGYDTVVGSGTVHVSGGEKQRIVIARAILQNTPIIVLDEATAFNDPENEYLIQSAFEKLLTGKTVIMIAHRLNTIRNADQILVMDRGKIIEAGKHDDLLGKKGKYQAMWEAYTQAKSWRIGGGKNA